MYKVLSMQLTENWPLIAENQHEIIMKRTLITLILTFFIGILITTILPFQPRIQTQNEISKTDFNIIITTTNVLAQTPAPTGQLPSPKLQNFLKWNSWGEFMQDVAKGLRMIGIIIFMGSFIVAGYLYMTSFGNDEQITKAKNAMFAAVIGIVLIIIGQVIITYIISYFYHP